MERNSEFLSTKEFLEQVQQESDAFMATIKTPEMARQVLIDAGLLDKDGKPAAWMTDPENNTMRWGWE